MKIFTHRQITPLAGLLFASLLTFGPAASALVLDNFNDNVKSGWTDTIAGGSITESGQKFNIATAAGGGSLTYSLKTSQGFTLTSGRILELRADVGAVSPAADANPLSILAWVPSGGAVLANGYSLSVGYQDVKILKNATVLYATNFVSAGTNIQNANITLVLRMTASGSSVTLKAQVYKQGLGLMTLLFERTVTDGSGIIGTAGNAALGVLNQASGASVSAAFDNLQYFDMTSGVLDNFDDNTLTSWSLGNIGGSGGAAETGQILYVNSGTGLAEYARKTSRTFKVVDGGRVEFRADIINNPAGGDNTGALVYLPFSAGAGGLIGYFVAPTLTEAANGKEYNKYWFQAATPLPPPAAGCRLTLAMTGEGTSCRIDSRIEDLNVADVNDPARLVYQYTFVDTPGLDAVGPNTELQGSYPNPAPYLNFDGYFALYAVNGGEAFPSEIYWDNAEYTETQPVNAAPICLNFSPLDGAAFVPAASSVSFNVQDDVNTTNIVLTLNGVNYTNGHPAVSVTGPNQNKLFTLTGALVVNTHYVGQVLATDNVGASATTPYSFDTFSTLLDYVVECEEYNFSDGLFINNPLLIVEGTTDPLAYNDQPGTVDVDFHDNRNNYDGVANEHTFRVNDNVKTAHSGDGPRKKYVDAGGEGAGFYENMVIEVENGDWKNYTHNYPAGPCNVYLRAAQYAIPTTLVTLDRVTNPTLISQTASPLGSFLGKTTGYDQHRPTLLTDGGGQPVILRLSGAVDTLRLSDRLTSIANSDFFENYMVFVPVPEPGTLRPILAMTLPPANCVVDYTSPAMNPSASIANRDTTVSTAPGDILLWLNGALATPTVTPTGSGADVTWPLSALPPTQTVTNKLAFKDSASVWQTNTWIYSYAAFLRATNSFPLGSLTVRGISARMVQVGPPELGNSLARAEDQLAIPPVIPYDVTASNMIQTVNWNENGTPNPVPGLAPGDYVNIAVEMFGYLELTAGAHRFQVSSDDRFQLRSGVTLADTGATVLGQAIGNTYSGTFDFMVEATGLYPVRCIWEENGGGANFFMWSVNPDASTPLVNDPTNPAGVVKSYFTQYPVRCLSASTATGPYAADGTAAFSGVTLTGGTITIPMAGSPKFYRLQGPKSTKVLTAVRSGSNLVLTYQIQ